MHPKALLDACAALVQQVLLLQHPADSVVSRFFRQNRSLGPRERATLAETAYTVLAATSCALRPWPARAAERASAGWPFWALPARAICWKRHSTRRKNLAERV